MDHVTAGTYWNSNAEAWTKLARAGYDVLRDRLNSPAFFAMLPRVDGAMGIDVGCGEGHNTRLLAKRGAAMTGIDIAPVFIRHAQEEEKRAPLRIAYVEASAVALPFADESFDFATAFMSLHDIPEGDQVLAEVFRVLRAGGFFQFSILHPCFNPPHRRVVRGEDRRAMAVEVGDYFVDARGRVDEWIFGAAPPSLRAKLPLFKVPRFHRPLSAWLNALIRAGFAIEQCAEPCPTDEFLLENPALSEVGVVPTFLLIRGRKPAD